MDEKILDLVTDVETEIETLTSNIEVHTESIRNAKEALKRLDKRKKQLLAMLEEEM